MIWNRVAMGSSSYDIATSLTLRTAVKQASFQSETWFISERA
jgi:hypothetical protein